MAVKIRLKRLGKIRAPHYRVVIMDSRAKRDGRAIEEIGKYHPTQDPSLIEIDSARAQYWLGVGAQPSEQVAALLKVTGDWQRFKGLPGAEGTLRVAEPRVDKKAVFEAAARATAEEFKDGATTARRRKTAAPAEPVATEPAAADTAAADTVATEPAAADTAAADSSQAAQDQAITEHSGLSEGNVSPGITPATASEGDAQPSSGGEVDQAAVPAGGAKSES